MRFFRNPAAWDFVPLANTIAYEYPTSGATAPTAATMRSHQQMSAAVTGDGSSTSLAITHNWNLSAAQIADQFPWYMVEPISGGNPPGLECNNSPTGRAANTITFTLTAPTSAVFRVRLFRPWSPTE
jgi:hypothetical protein